MIVLTGTAGFIGSVMLQKLNLENIDNVVIVDDFTKEAKENNFKYKQFVLKIHRNDFFPWFDKHACEVEQVIHLGARTDTTEFDVKVFNILNLEYSKQIWLRCAEHNIPLIYASSAATYGAGEWGYDDSHDSHEIVEKLKPLNAYGNSKNDFDKWALRQEKQPPFWAGLKFFNVYGPNEYHKGRMASVIFHAFYQSRETGKVRLFRSHRPDFKDGEQLRDFVYVKDVV